MRSRIFQLAVMSLFLYCLCSPELHSSPVAWSHTICLYRNGMLIYTSLLKRICISCVSTDWREPLNVLLWRRLQTRLKQASVSTVNVLFVAWRAGFTSTLLLPHANTFRFGWGFQQILSSHIYTCTVKIILANMISEWNKMHELRSTVRFFFLKSCKKISILHYFCWVFAPQINMLDYQVVQNKGCSRLNEVKVVMREMCGLEGTGVICIID